MLAIDVTDTITGEYHMSGLFEYDAEYTYFSSLHLLSGLKLKRKKSVRKTRSYKNTRRLLRSN